MERQHDFPAELATRAVTDLGKAFESWHAMLAAHTTTIIHTNDEIERIEALGQTEKAQSVKDPIAEEFKAQREKFARQESEFQQASALLASTGGILFSSSPAAEAAHAASESAKIRQQLVDVQEAHSRGLINLDETNSALKKLNHQLKLSQGKEALHGSGGSEGSRLSKLTQAAVPSMVEGLKKGAQSVAGQIEGVGTGAMSTLSGALPVAGGLALFGLMLWGFKEADRMRAEMGELVNLAVAAGGNAHSRGMAWMAGFQEKCQKFYGVSRKEVQGIFKDFIDAGISMDSVFRTYDKSLGEVGENAISLTLAADRHFELSAGTTSRAVTQAVTQYGMELSKAADLITNMEFEASHTGFGIGKFVSWTMQASMNIRHLGIGIEEVASAAFSMRKFYEKSGVDSETWSKDSVSEMLSGMQGMGVGREIWAAENLGLGQGIEGRQALREGLMRKDPTMLRKLAGLWRRDAVTAGGGDEMEARFYLEKQGFGTEGAKAVMELGDDTENDAKVHGKKKEDRQKLRDSFKEESTRVSDLEKKKNELLAGFAKAGQGLLQMLSGFMALLIVSVKGLPYYLMGGKEESAKARAEMQVHLDAISKGATQFLAGGKESLSAIWSTLQPMLEPMIEAWGFDAQDSAEFDAFSKVDASKMLGQYGALAPSTFRTLYRKGEQVDLSAFTVPAAPPPPPLPRPSAPSKAPAPTSAPGPIALPPLRQPLFSAPSQPIILGAVQPSSITLEVDWQGDPNATDFVAHVTTTTRVG